MAQLYAWKTGEGFRAEGEPVPFGTDGYFYGDQVVIGWRWGCLPLWVQVRAWETAGGATFEQAALAGAWTGVSNVLFIPQTGSPSRPEACIDANLIGLEYPGIPLFVQQPQSQTIRAGERATLSVIASSGVETAYQWYGQPNERPDGLIIGATDPTYTTPALQADAAFWVTVANSAGSVTSDRATVTVVHEEPALALSTVEGIPALTIAGTSGIPYRIESATDLAAGAWSTLADVVLGGSALTLLDPDGAAGPARFYRVVVP